MCGAQSNDLGYLDEVGMLSLLVRETLAVLQGSTP